MDTKKNGYNFFENLRKLSTYGKDEDISLDEWKDKYLVRTDKLGSDKLSAY